MVMVPRSRYEFLIELYASNMADINAKFLQKQIESKNGEKEVSIEKESK